MKAELPLLVETPDTWADAVLADLVAFLNDHAHLEKKAASNALEMLHRWPGNQPSETWVKGMTAVAKDEVEHLALVTRVLARRGGELTRNHRNPYANELHAHVRLGRGREETLDRLIISALIEARSAERFEILSRRCEDEELRTMYADLWTSEHGHYRMFLKLAQGMVHEREVDARWTSFLEFESDIIQGQEPGPRMHTWV